MNRTVNTAVRRPLMILLVLAAIVLVVGPLLWSLSTSLKLGNEILSAPPELLPGTYTAEHYERLVREGVGTSFANSLINSIATVVFSLVIGTAAGYALSRFTFKGSRPMLLLFVASMTIPAYSLLLPTQVIFDGIGLLNTSVVLPLLYSAHAIPLVVWVTKTQFDALPIDLEQAAAVDGYTRWESVWKIVLPGARPALIAGAAYAFLVALIFYQGFSGREWGPLMAGVVVATIPPVVLFIVFRRYLIGGFLSGAIKG